MTLSLVDPYGKLAGGQWLRGNLHTHTTHSDGARPPQEVIDDYAARGYGFLMLSDHDYLTSEAALKKLDGRGMVLIPGNEISRGGPHMLHVDADRLIMPDGTRQQTLNAVLDAAKESGRGFAIVNHPNWQEAFDHATREQLGDWWGYLGMEIYNGVINRLDGSPYALDKWDLLLSAGRRVWGFANDDCHRAVGEIELGWNVAYVKEKTPAAVVEALRSGRFYSSTGVAIKSISVEGLTIRVETENAQRIVAIRDVGKRIATVEGPVMEIEVPAAARYVRFQCYGPGEKMAWTQPFFTIGEGIAEKFVSPFIPEWSVSNLSEGMTLAEADPQKVRFEGGTKLSVPTTAKGLLGFADVRELIKGQPGVVFLGADVVSESDRRAVLHLGYDGPIRVWLNGEAIFDGPGTNPALASKLAVYGRFRRGVNKLLVALDTNNGKAWGIFGRVDWKV